MTLNCFITTKHVLILDKSIDMIMANDRGQVRNVTETSCSLFSCVKIMCNKHDVVTILFDKFRNLAKLGVKLLREPVIGARNNDELLVQIISRQEAIFIVQLH